MVVMVAMPAVVAVMARPLASAGIGRDFRLRCGTAGAPMLFGRAGGVWGLAFWCDAFAHEHVEVTVLAILAGTAGWAGGGARSWGVSTPGCVAVGPVVVCLRGRRVTQSLLEHVGRPAKAQCNLLRAEQIVEKQVN